MARQKRSSSTQKRNGSKARQRNGAKARQSRNDAGANTRQAKKPSNAKQKGRQQGSQTGREAFKSNSADFYRHPGQGMRGKEGGAREAEREPGGESTGSDTRKHTRPEQER